VNKPENTIIVRSVNIPPIFVFFEVYP